MSKVNVNAIEPSTGTDITLGASGDTITIPSGATFTQSGTMNASAITAGTMAIARGGTGAATFAAAGLTNAPSFYAYQSTVANAIATGTYTELPWSATNWDTDSAFASNGFTVPTGEGGDYLINGIFCMNGLNDDDRWDTHLTINGSRNAKGVYYNAATGTNKDLYNNMSVIKTLAAGDKVTITGYHNYGSDRDFNGTFSYFAGYKLIGI